MPAKALLLDRDGVINVDHGYVASRDRFVFIDGIFPLARAAVDHGYRIVVVTNQSGIARGYYTDADFRALTAWMAGEFERQGAALAGVFHCPFLVGAVDARYARDSFWRKPNPGMILEARRAFDLDLARSILVGDQPGDIAAARAAGVGRTVLVRASAAAGEADRVVSAPAEVIAHLI